MKTLLTSALALLVLTSASAAGDGHDHGKIIPGPKGGRIVEVEGGHAEFLVQPDRKVAVIFYGEDMKAVNPSEQVVTLVAEAPSGKEKLEFEKTADQFVSKAVLPDGDGYRIVLQIRASAGAKPQNFRIDYHTETCGGCSRAEYACICAEESGGGHGGHAH
ncbi:hypothetical protein DB345_07975 [Spartobacteria bacterium LR76]|nr:hypothetical protein DB345_07975 [Spartobacteria bacterium LR76]